MPDITCTSREEKTMAVFQAAQERLLFLLWGNSEGGHKFKPCLFYYSEIPLHRNKEQGHIFYLLWIKSQSVDLNKPFFENGS